VVANPFLETENGQKRRRKTTIEYRYLSSFSCWHLTQLIGRGEGD
jgi:hypothetical protein